MKKLIDKNTIYYFITLLLIWGYIGTQHIYPIVGKFANKAKEVSRLKSQINMEKMTQERMAITVTKQLPYNIYKSEGMHGSIENKAVVLVDQLVNKINQTGNKIIEISFHTKDSLKSQGANSRKPYQISIGGVTYLKLKFLLSSSYSSIKNLTEELYNWEYLSLIYDINIKPETDESYKIPSAQASTILRTNFEVLLFLEN